MYEKKSMQLIPHHFYPDNQIGRHIGNFWECLSQHNKSNKMSNNLISQLYIWKEKKEKKLVTINQTHVH